MKKVVIAAFTLFTLGAVSAQAQTQTPATPNIPATTAPATAPAGQTAPATATPATEDRTAVKIEELPAAVKATLASSPSLKAWLPTEAFLVKGANGKEFYAINLKKENESGSIQLDKDGKPVK